MLSPMTVLMIILSNYIGHLPQYAACNSCKMNSGQYEWVILKMQLTIVETNDKNLPGAMYYARFYIES